MTTDDVHSALLKPQCGRWIPVAGTGTLPTALISMPCSEIQDHEGPCRTSIVTPEWRVTIEGEGR